MLQSSKYLLTVLTICLLTGCAQNEPLATSASISTATSTPALPIEQTINAAFRERDPDVRRRAVLDAVQRFLNDETNRDLPDDQISAKLTQLAFGSEHITLPDPAFVRRDGPYAVVGVPDGLGLFFYDLSRPEIRPIEISRWTVGISSVNVIWRGGEFGVAYETVGSDDIRRVHFALLVNNEGEWRTSWLSDETPDWWFNAQDAALEIAPDLSQITVTGMSESRPLAFQETEDTPRRVFRLIWMRALNLYKLETYADSYASREEWMWAMAQPSPYSSIVEFVERLQRRDENGAAHLATNPGVIDDAMGFGFYLIDASYKVILSEPDRLIIQGSQGTFEVSFLPPSQQGAPWRISSVKPVGVPE